MKRLAYLLEASIAGYFEKLMTMIIPMTGSCSLMKMPRGKVTEGVNLLSDAVKVTMGPRGRNVVIERAQ